MITRSISCFLLVCITSVAALGVQPSQINLKERYNPDRHISISHRVLDNGDSLEIWMEVLLHRRGEDLSYYTLMQEELSDYSQNITFTDTVDISTITHTATENRHVLRWSVPKADAPALLFFIFDHKSRETNYYHDILLDERYVILPPYAVSDEQGIPLFSSWVSSGQPFGVIGADTSALLSTRYAFDSPPADPPMKTEQDEVSATMQIDSTFSLDVSSTHTLDTEGLYYFRKKDSGAMGASLLVQDPYFPRARTIEAIIGPLIYISTAMERTALVGSLDKKQALDNFLMDATRSPERGKWLMKYYFRQVAEANALFTTYKEGWKTDQGMVYTLYGLPDAVYRTEKGEEWVYEKTEEMSKIRFNFARIKNPYTNRHFVLLRSKSYERPWFTNVDLWRKARKDL
ncbi:GWxTD domain-containing protein [Roseivirga sp. BDSF3-8]|uniref:GWxTD domain-containing protein n=1 Tax=Roseivirga sp. BDSF3-8 TaxID=3241598 RepID=UPI003531ECFD